MFLLRKHSDVGYTAMRLHWEALQLRPNYTNGATAPHSTFTTQIADQPIKPTSSSTIPAEFKPANVRFRPIAGTQP
jgi:hypothetical protein